MVRFLRNATVAKIAGKDSSLLQVSSEERERVARVTEWFGEEDLTRHLQIMLRTHGELGYKQEQRFHLELGLLKMAHAQKLLPIEQLLSDAAIAPTAGAQRPRPAIVGGAPNSEPRRPDLANARPTFVSPFAADSARKGTPRQEAPSDPAPSIGPRIVATASTAEPIIMGSAAPMRDAAREPDHEADRRDVASYVSAGAAKSSAPEPQPDLQAQPAPATAAAEPRMEQLQNAVLQALTDGNQRILVSMLSAGEWSVQGNELVIKVGESQTVVDMSLSSDAKRLAIACASGILGRAVKLRVVPSATVNPQENKRNGATHVSSGPGGRGRAEQDPVVRRMQEKFGAQVRTVIDYRDKR
jgi:DNA polymerase-3 subunit gamma/tau